MNKKIDKLLKLIINQDKHTKLNLYKYLINIQNELLKQKYFQIQWIEK